MKLGRRDSPAPDSRHLLNIMDGGGCAGDGGGCGDGDWRKSTENVHIKTFTALCNCSESQLYQVTKACCIK